MLKGRVQAIDELCDDLGYPPACHWRTKKANEKPAPPTPTTTAPSHDLLRRRTALERALRFRAARPRSEDTVPHYASPSPSSRGGLARLSVCAARGHVRRRSQRVHPRPRRLLADVPRNETAAADPGGRGALDEHSTYVLSAGRACRTWLLAAGIGALRLAVLKLGLA